MVVIGSFSLLRSTKASIQLMDQCVVVALNLPLAVSPGVNGGVGS